VTVNQHIENFFVFPQEIMDFYTEVIEFNRIRVCHMHEIKLLEKFGGQ
jgi:hypothetical protein